MARKKKQEEPKRGAPGWMVSYGDMMTLLLVFFVLLYSFSIVDMQEFIKAIGSVNAAIHGTTGILEVEGASTQKLGEAGKTLKPSEAKGGGENILEGAAGLKISISEEEIAAMEQLKEEIQQNVNAANMGASISLTTSDRGLLISLTDKVLFNIGEADLKPEVLPILRTIGKTLKDTDYVIRVEGYTCDIPISTPEYRSNWELSADRAISVLRYVIENVGFPPERLSVAGYGEYKPRVPNDAEANRALNRRVDMVVLYPTLNIQEPKTEAIEGR